MAYRIQVRRGAQKQLDRIDPRYRERIIEAVYKLSEDPKPFPASMKLEGREGRRLRVGNYRVLYRIDDRLSEVLVLEIWHRQRDYRC